MELASKDSCTGCGNCRLVCKKKAVTFTRDALNNIYPVIDSSKCVECGLCQKACPAINQVEKITPKQCYSCYATNEAIRKSSASGGVAQAIYRWCLKNDIPFAGVYFDNKELTAKYKLGFSEEDIHQFVNSKYTFSFMGSISEEWEIACFYWFALSGSGSKKICRNKKSQHGEFVYSRYHLSWCAF